MASNHWQQVLSQRRVFDRLAAREPWVGDYKADARKQFALQQRLEEREIKVSRPDLMRDLGQVQSVLVELDGQRHQLRTDMAGAAYQAFAAAGVRPPSPVTHLGPVVS